MEPSGKRLTDAIEVVRKRIQQFRDRKETIGEQNTKAALIEPILSALGWDLQEFDEVRREYRRKAQDNPVDYALFLNRTECLLIEAKALEKDVDDRRWISQNISYAAVVGVRWCVLTNGDEYRIYNSHAEVDVDEKLFRKVSVSITEPRFLADTLMLLSREKMRGSLLDDMWKAHFIDRKVRHAFEVLLSQEDAPLVRAICKKASGVTASEARASLKRAKITIDFPLPKPFDPPPLAAAPVVTNVAGASCRESRRKTASSPVMVDATLNDLIAHGLLTAPVAVERTYKGVKLSATVNADGQVVLNGTTFTSLSTAAGMARKAIIGAPPGRPYPQTNGWTFWQLRDVATGHLRDLDSLRKEFLANKNSR